MNNHLENDTRFPGMEHGCIKIGLRYNGWIYYANPLMGDSLYKVRENGTDNTQLTDSSVLSYSFKVKNGKLVFQDFESHQHEISLA